jgi:hypothetical protein
MSTTGIICSLKMEEAPENSDLVGEEEEDEIDIDDEFEDIEEDDLEEDNDSGK